MPIFASVATAPAVVAVDEQVRLAPIKGPHIAITPHRRARVRASPTPADTGAAVYIWAYLMGPISGRRVAIVIQTITKIESVTRPVITNNRSARTDGQSVGA